MKDSGRAEYVFATDEEALRAFRTCTQLEGIIPGAFEQSFNIDDAKGRSYHTALESAHAVWQGMRIAKTLPASKDVVIVSVSFLT